MSGENIGNGTINVGEGELTSALLEALKNNPDILQNALVQIMRTHPEVVAEALGAAIISSLSNKGTNQGENSPEEFGDWGNFQDRTGEMPENGASESGASDDDVVPTGEEGANDAVPTSEEGASATGNDNAGDVENTSNAGGADNAPKPNPEPSSDNKGDEFETRPNSKNGDNDGDSQSEFEEAERETTEDRINYLAAATRPRDFEATLKQKTEKLSELKERIAQLEQDLSRAKGIISQHDTYYLGRMKKWNSKYQTAMDEVKTANAAIREYDRELNSIGAQLQNISDGVPGDFDAVAAKFQGIRQYVDKQRQLAADAMSRAQEAESSIKSFKEEYRKAIATKNQAPLEIAELKRSAERLEKDIKAMQINRVAAYDVAKRNTLEAEMNRKVEEGGFSSLRAYRKSLLQGLSKKSDMFDGMIADAQRAIDDNKTDAALQEKLRERLKGLEERKKLEIEIDRKYLENIDKIYSSKGLGVSLLKRMAARGRLFWEGLPKAK